MRTKRLIPIIIAVTVVLFFAIVVVVADVTTTLEVFPGNMQDWQTQTVAGAQPAPASTPSVSFVNGPATPPLGSGSAQLSVGSDGGAIAQLRQPDYAATALPTPTPVQDPNNPVVYLPASNELTELSYSTYIQQAGSGSQAPYIILDVDYDNNGTVDDHLVFDPQYQVAGFCPSKPQGPVTPGVWQTWNALSTTFTEESSSDGTITTITTTSGCWYSTQGVAGSGPGANVKPLLAITAAQPNAKIVNSGSDGGVRIVAGGGGVIGGGAASDWSGFVGNVDDFRIGVGFDPDNGPLVTEYDFEASGPTPPQSADLLVTKTANTSGVTPGATITYTIQVSNQGPNDATNVVLNDTLPSPTTFNSLTHPNDWSCSDPGTGNTGTVTCTKSTFTANASAVFTLVVDVPQNATPNPNNPYITNEATATSDTNDSNPVNNTGSASTSFGTCLTNPVVTTNTDSGPGSLRQAIADACDGATITFDMSQVTSPVTLTSDELLINKNLTIQGPGANVLTVQRSAANLTPTFRIFEIANSAITVNISGMTISNGHTADGTTGSNGGSGGGILNNASATLNLRSVALTGNQTGAGGPGGGAGGGVSNSGTLTLVNSTINGNQTGAGFGGGAGGGVSNSGTMTLVNSTISGNQTGIGNGGSGGSGGGVSNSSGTLTLVNSTISGNQTGAGFVGSSGGFGGGIFNGAATVDVKNTIIAGNSVAAGGSGPDLSGTFNSQDYNLIGSTSGATIQGTTTHNITGVSANLGPLQNNGGPTQTMQPLPGSPAINAGDPNNLPPDTFDLNNNGDTAEPLPVDQRGFTRVVGSGFDIGAVEVQAGTPDHLAFSVQPSNSIPGAVITPAVKVQILDVANNLTTSNANVTIAIGTNPSGGTLSGTTTVAAVNGTATFGNLSINNPGSGYTLTANSTGLVGATSNAFSVLSPANVSGTKAASGTFNVGNTVTYTVVLSNSGPATQLDNPGNEFTDVLPAGLTLVSANATSGTAVATVGTNTVTWNGSIPSGNSVTITIQATIKSGQEGQTITNQGSIAYDADGNGTNESSALTNQSSFKVNNPPTISAVGVTRAAGSPSANSTIANVNDAEDAKNTLAVTVNNSSSATVTGVTVSNLSVNTSGVVSADVVAACGATTANFTLKVTDSGGLSNTATLTVTVNANTAPTLTYNSPQTVEFGGSLSVTPATGPSDNGSINSIVVQSQGTYTGTISVNNSTGVVSISNAAPAGTHTITIRATDNCGTTTDASFSLVVKPQPGLSINDVTLAEGNSGTTNFTFTVTLSASSNLTVTVNYATADGTATIANNDYQAASGTLTFNPGETSKTITVKVNGDTTTEPDETFTVNLTTPTNASISRAQGTGTILNDDAPAIQFSAPTYTVGEGDGRAVVTVNRLGDTSQPASVDYATSDQSGLNNCSQITGFASQRCDYAITIGKLKFAAGESSKQILIPIVDDAYMEGPEVFTLTLSNPSGGILQGSSSVPITITDNDLVNGSNPLDQDSFFIRQLYIDFLDREPDPAGLQGWLNRLNNCSPPTDCDRIAVALGFVNSAEFTDRGYFIYRLYKTLPDTSNPTFGRIPHYFEFTTDMAKVSGFLSTTDLNAAKDAFITEFMNRAEFKAKYDATLNDPMGYVDALLQTVNLPNHPSRTTWINGLTNGTLTRGQVLRLLVESAEVYARFKNEGFVIMNYFGFLRRDADAAFADWIKKFNDTNDQRLIINGFLNSTEFRQRFAP
jgi:uncharacterized repeat protein (TIGR01451 family)